MPFLFLLIKYFRYLPSSVYTDVLNSYFAEACENIWLKQMLDGHINHVTRCIGIDLCGSAGSLYSMRNSTTSVNWKFKCKLNSLCVVLWNIFSINQWKSQTKKYSTKVLEVAEAHLCKFT